MPLDLKITQISNHWLLFKKEGGLYQKVGIISLKSSKSTLLLFEKSKAILTNKMIDNTYLFYLTTEDYTLNSFFNYSKQNFLKWKKSTSEEFLECFFSFPYYFIKARKKKIAKILPFSSDAYIIKIKTKVDIPPIVLLGSILPLIKKY